MPISTNDLLANIVEAFVEMDSELRVVDMNSNAEILLRRERSTALGHPLESLIPDASRSQHWPAFVDTVRNGRNETIAVFYPAQYRWHDIKVVPQADGGAGLLMRDVTDRQWLIRREAERVYLRNVFEDAPVAITVARGRNLVIEYMNAFARQIIGNRGAVGLGMREAFPDVEQKELFDVVERVYATGTPFHARDLYVRFDRNNDAQLEEAYFDVTYQAIRDFDGTISGILSLSIEVTDRIRGDRENKTP